MLKNLRNNFLKICLISLLLAGGGISSKLSAQYFLTDFAKENNIYTDLNEQFPNTEFPDTTPPVAGSGTGTPNNSFLFDPNPSAVAAAGYAPNYVSGSNVVNNGVNFLLTSNSGGYDFSQIGYGGVVTLAANISNVTNVYVLAAAYNQGTLKVTFTGQDGATETFDTINLPDFNGQTTNFSDSNFFDETVFETYDRGAGGTGNSETGDVNNYDLTELGFTLNSTLANEKLSSITFTGEGNTDLIMGVTAIATPEPSTFAMLSLGGLMLVLVLRRLKRAASLRG
jgi:hypothetical protein